MSPAATSVAASGDGGVGGIGGGARPPPPRAGRSVWPASTIRSRAARVNPWPTTTTRSPGAAAARVSVTLGCAAAAGAISRRAQSPANAQRGHMGPSIAAGRAGVSAPAPSRLRPTGHVVDGAEGVRDAVLAAVAHEHQVNVAEDGAALCAGLERVCDSPRLDDLARLPVSALDRPRDYVLEPAEGRLARPGELLDAPAVVPLDLTPAPVTLVAHGAPNYRAGGRRDRPGAART